MQNAFFDRYTFVFVTIIGKLFSADMKHASIQILQSNTELLDQLRSIDAIQEKKLGVFYLKSRAFLHFHEDRGTLFADVRLDGLDFRRVAANTPDDQKRLVRKIRQAVKL